MEKPVCGVIPALRHQEKAFPMEPGKPSVVARGGGGRGGQSTEGFRAEELVCMILGWRTHIIVHLSKPTERLPPTGEPKVNCGLLLLIMYQYWLSDCNKGLRPAGGGSIWGLSCSMLSFSASLKPL